MSRTDLDTGSPHFYPCTVIRVTEHNTRGSLRHSAALSYHFAEPVTLAYCPVYATGDLVTTARPVATLPPPPAITAVMAPADHDERKNIAALAHCLWLYGTQHAAVEGWIPLEDGRWHYLLVPRWHDALDTDVWTAREPDGYRIFAAGHAMSTTEPYRWPSPAPVPDQPPGEGTRLFSTVNATPPPPQGFPVHTPTPVSEPAAEARGVRVEYRARIPRQQLGAAVAEAFGAITDATTRHRKDTD